VVNHSDAQNAVQIMKMFGLLTRLKVNGKNHQLHIADICPNRYLGRANLKVKTSSKAHGDH
tara:strand:+ start:107 stop:289 length:183 start_codon:yes stop_codon:yes gene_type:complete